MGGATRTSFQSETPDLDRAQEYNMDALSRMTREEDIQAFLERCNFERDEIRARRRIDCKREDEIDICEDAALRKLKELRTHSKSDVKEATGIIEEHKIKKHPRHIVLNINLNGGDDE